MDMDQTEEWLTTQQLAAEFHVHPRTILRLIERGVLPALKVGRKWMIHTADADRWKASRYPQDTDV